MVEHPKITPTTVGEYVEKHPASDKIGTLFAGSWIQHNFGIWLGHPECNQAWDLVFETREHLMAATKGAEGPKTADQLAQARRELFIAEGSDWFWWFGDSHHSAQQDLFDTLFRKHLQNVYAILGDPIPSELLRPIRGNAQQPRMYSEPTSLLNVKIDGRFSYFEWLNSGYYAPTHGRGAMSVGTATRTEGFYYGFDADNLFLRLDARGGPMREQWSDIDSLRVVFKRPAGYELLVLHPSRPEPIAQLYRHDVPVSRAEVQIAADAVVEIAIPWKSLAVSQDDSVHLYVELMQHEQPMERIPHEGCIETTVPSPDYEYMMWQV